MKLSGRLAFLRELLIKPIAGRIDKLITEDNPGKRISQNPLVARARLEHYVAEHVADAIAFERKRLHKDMTPRRANVARKTGPESIKVDKYPDVHERQFFSPKRLPEFISMSSQLTSTKEGG